MPGYLPKKGIPGRGVFSVLHFSAVVIYVGVSAKAIGVLLSPTKRICKNGCCLQVLPRVVVVNDRFAVDVINYHIKIAVVVKIGIHCAVGKRWHIHSQLVVASEKVRSALFLNVHNCEALLRGFG